MESIDLSIARRAQRTPRAQFLIRLLTQVYTLDGLGNWKTHKKNSSTYNQTINSLNQYSVFNGPAGQRSLYYNFMGNLENEYVPGEQSRMYSYDFLNRLVRYIGVDDTVTDYHYDALGRRISKSLNGLRTRFVYDGARLIEERDGANDLIASYVMGIGVDEVLSRWRPTGGSNPEAFFHTNALGSVAALTDNTGAVVERYKYDAYGQVTFLNSTFGPLTSSGYENNILFTGRYYDTESKLYYYRARSYHPYLGRFIQRDPLGESQGPNLYNYVFNNPVRFTDPSGLKGSDKVNPTTGLTAQQEADAAEMMADLKAGFDTNAAMDRHAMAPGQGPSTSQMQVKMGRRMLGLPEGDGDTIITPSNDGSGQITESGQGDSSGEWPTTGVRVTERFPGKTTVWGNIASSSTGHSPGYTPKCTYDDLQISSTVPWPVLAIIGWSTQGRGLAAAAFFGSVVAGLQQDEKSGDYYVYVGVGVGFDVGTNVKGYPIVSYESHANAGTAGTGVFVAVQETNMFQAWQTGYGVYTSGPSFFSEDSVSSSVAGLGALVAISFPTGFSGNMGDCNP